MKFFSLSSDKTGPPLERKTREPALGGGVSERMTLSMFFPLRQIIWEILLQFIATLSLRNELSWV